MSLDNYSELVGAVGDWLDRADLATRSADFVRLTEARLNRLLDDPEMEVTLTASAIGGALTLPDDFGQMVSISTGNGRLSPMGVTEFSALAGVGLVSDGGAFSFEGEPDGGVTMTVDFDPATVEIPVQSGEPRYYTIAGGVIRFYPSSVNRVTMFYRRSIPALSAAVPTNWLLRLAPDVYLYGALVQASAFLAEDDRVGAWKSAFDEAIGELRIDGSRRKWGAGQLAPRIRRT